MSRRRLLFLGVMLVALIFAVQGGEYSTWDWLSLRKAEARERVAVDSLTREVDSLDSWAKAIETDPKVQERLARELYTMVRPGEFVYRLVPAEQP